MAEQTAAQTKGRRETCGGEEEEEEEEKPVNSIQIGKFVSQNGRDAGKPQGGVTPFPKHTLSPHQCPVSSQTFSWEAFQKISRFWFENL